MHCQTCGAPMTVERDYFHCEYCGTYHIPIASPEGVRLLGESPEGLKCPVCRLPLHVAALSNSVRDHQCVKCRGLLLNRFEFGDTVLFRRRWAATPPDPPYALDQTELARRLHCPRCGRPMNTHSYLGPGNTVIDTCDVCDLIWLDHAELERSVNAPGRDRDAALQPARCPER